MYCCLLGPKNVGNVWVELRAGDLDLAASIVDDGPVGCPKDELLAACGNRDAHEVTEKNPVLSVAVMLANDAESMGVGRERRLHLTVLIHRSKAVGNAELLGDSFRRESQEVVDHAVSAWSLALVSLFL